MARSSSRTSRARALALALVTAAAGCAGADEEVTIAVASSLRNVMPELIATFEAREPGAPLVATYGGSGDLKRQVEAGAPIDAVVFAGAQPVDELVEQGLVDPASRRTLAHNELVLIVPAGGAEVTFATLGELPEGERIAIGDPASVPVGRYAREWLQALGSWDALEPRLVLAPHVAAVLAFARRGEAAAAVVYRTDVAELDDVLVRDDARGEGAPTPVVVAAVTAGGHARAARLLDFAASGDGRAILGRHGFEAP